MCDRKAEHSVLGFLSHKNAPRGSHCGGKEACCQKQPAAGGESCGAGFFVRQESRIPLLDKATHVSYNYKSDISVANDTGEVMGKKSEETKRRIREGACALFAKKGFKNVTMKDICEETGLSRGGLYRYYESTYQIFSDIADELMSAQDHELWDQMEREVPAPRILDRILERYRQEMLDSGASLSVAIYEFHSEHAQDGGENMLQQQYRASAEMWEAFIDYGIRRGEFREVNGKEVADILIFAYQGVRMYSTILPLEEEIPRRIVEHVKKVLLK